jgi:hypothetical protein
MGLRADLEAMTADAQAWYAASTVLDTAKQSAAGLTLEESTFCFAGGDVAALYETARKQVEDLLAGGATETGNAADTLIEVRDDFEGTDASERDRHVGAWDPQ